MARYLAKYVGAVDEASRVYIAPPNRSNPTGLTVTAESVGNTKSTSVAIAEKAKKKEDRRQHQGRLLSQPEALMLLLDIPQVYTDIKFVHVPTVPLEERPALDRVPPIVRLLQEKVVRGPITSISDLGRRWTYLFSVGDIRSAFIQ